jgi:hypothetical protein
MSALRRDLLEGKLWIVVALLIACVVAVPLLLLKGASAGGATTPPAPPPTSPSQTTTASTQTTPSKEPAKVVLARIARNPFAGAVPKLSSQPAAQTRPSSPTASSANPTTTTSATTTSPSMVSPSPATASSTASTTAASPVSTTPTSTVASTAPARIDTLATPRSWTIYSVSVRYGKDLSVPAKSDIARLTPLPNVVQPQVMFMGVMWDGTSAVFALHAGLERSGPGLCRPDHLRCAAIVLKAGQTEHLVISTATGRHQHVILRVVKISSRITHSRTVALAAYHHVSAAGQCVLDLANPVSYDSATGTISSVARSACEKHRNAVPFAYLVTAP